MVFDERDDHPHDDEPLSTDSLQDEDDTEEEEDDEMHGMHIEGEEEEPTDML